MPLESDPHSDLTTAEGVQSYLSLTPFAASKVTVLEGGAANFVYRIELQKPYSVTGPKASLGPIHTVVLKHAQPHARNSTFPLAVERQIYEVLAFERVSEIMTSPSLPIVSLPTLYHEDRENCALIISDCGEASCILKSLLQTAPPNDDVSRTIGHSLGRFLARLHNASLNSDSSPPSPSPGVKIKAAFASNKQGRDISALITYGRLVATLAPSSESQSAGRVFVTPPLDLSPAQLAIVARIAEEMQQRIKTSDDVLTMGDFWPGNILVSLEDRATNDGMHICVVDWELAKPGLAGLDVGQFLAEMSQMVTFHSSSKASVDAIVSGFTGAYRDESLRSGTEMDLKEVMHIAATHVGAHLIAWTPRCAWGEMKLTRQVVREGVEYILRVANKDEKWLRTSVVGGLVG